MAGPVSLNGGRRPPDGAASGALPPSGVQQDGRSFLPQLRGEVGDPREWVFCHYYPDWGNSSRSRFARDHRWKLYGDGRLYEVARRTCWKSIRWNGVALGPEGAEARERLLEVLDRLQ